MRERLSDTQERMNSIDERFDARISTHAYPNGDIDGEISVSIPRGIDATDVGRALEQAFQVQPHGLAFRFWFSIGVRASIKEDEELYRRFKGLNEVGLYYRRVTTTALFDNFQSLYNFRVVEGKRYPPLVENVEEKYRRKIEVIYIRLHWNPANQRPER